MKKIQDSYFFRAKRENYPARSVYKLKEIQARFKIFKPGMRVLDLGAAPGSWSLAAAEYIGIAGRVLGLDLQGSKVAFPPQVTFTQADVFDPGPEFMRLLWQTGPFHVVISDMAPSTTGNRFTDQARSAALVLEAFALARANLRLEGSFVVKFFMSPGVQAFSRTLRKEFSLVKSFKPQSSRPESFESFYIAKGFKGLPPPDPGPVPDLPG
ncbi:MAG: RlmE family RNA methyltransferase [Deltaproteobacteria bacterium]|jgi:23S rRNA (uridine2552-2'-O)-methyltransferase|nr:RlmE family RNA methyltransferase [Deltaproteobacteria bacterium]